MALYVSSKHALKGYSESLDHQVRDVGFGWKLTFSTATASDCSQSEAIVHLDE
jgi:short-subunit dehydrogenase